MPVFSDIDHFVMIHWTTDLGLVWDQSNPISKKVGSSILQVNFYSSTHIKIDTLIFYNLRDTPTEITWSKKASTD